MVAGCASGVEASTLSIVSGIPVNGMRRSRNASTATSSAALRAMQWAPPFRGRLVGQAQAGKALKIRLFEVEMAQRGEVEGQIRDRALRVGESVQDGQAHVGDGDLRQDRAINVLDQRVDGRLRMDRDADLCRGKR